MKGLSRVCTDKMDAELLAGQVNKDWELMYEGACDDCNRTVHCTYSTCTVKTRILKSRNDVMQEQVT